MGSAAPKNLGDLDVLIVGGGFCGVWQLHTLRNEGFNVLLVEAGAALGGIWYWNNYPGARVDCSVPTYQLTEPGPLQDFDWKHSFPGRDELVEYFRYVDKVWDLSKDVRYQSRVTSMRWDEEGRRWRVVINDGEAEVTAWNVVLCTGFASKRYVPPFKGLEMYKGEIHHTAVWPQEGVSLKKRNVAVIGTGASGVQAIQEVAKEARRMTVYQRTPNTALPMHNPAPDNAKVRADFPEVSAYMRKTFAGFDYEFQKSDIPPTQLPKEERLAFYEKLYHSGGLHLWLAPWIEILFDEGLNEEVYQFWRSKTIPRINDPVRAEMLAPAKKIHPFGTKRISLEKDFFEVFNQDNVDLIDLRSNNIQEFTETGIRTADGKHQDFDLVILATGFDSQTGSIKQIDIQNGNGETIAKKWEHGTYTTFGMATNGFPNLFFTYGPQAPTAFATGPASAETQGGWIVEALKHMRESGVKTMETTKEAELEWRQHVNDIANMSLLPKADSWYMGANIPGKPREALNYLGGLPAYRKKLWDECANQGYKGFVLSK
ncbi:Baeyer-Villiger monooxygenase [Pseudocercospora fuligena]|uniref:Baeyer-Villiger monooxygenase n=1 Tax=Pseudocercospora fuligena TaxID=685502 RepID=A0A8H6RGL8_9PEZI|nr:Baeyer-Villiger monooxygenase [Pseudocercospora fuligena]